MAQEQTARYSAALAFLSCGYKRRHFAFMRSLSAILRARFATISSPMSFNSDNRVIGRFWETTFCSIDCNLQPFG